MIHAGSLQVTVAVNDTQCSLQVCTKNIIVVSMQSAKILTLVHLCHWQTAQMSELAENSGLDLSCVLGVHIQGKLGQCGAVRCRREDRVVWLVLLVE